MIVSYAGRDGRQVVLADSNPGIMALPTATLASLSEVRRAPELAVPVQGWPRSASAGGAGGAASAGGDAGAGGDGDAGPHARPGRILWPPPGGMPGNAPPPGGMPGNAPSPWQLPGKEPPANVGPPPERLDWRSYRR
jgi:hypothetical protein